jgi:hypothetical protein
METMVCMSIVYAVAVVVVEGGGGVAHVGGAQGGRYLQWEVGQLRCMDEFKFKGCHLHVQGW